MKKIWVLMNVIMISMGYNQSAKSQSIKTKITNINAESSPLVSQNVENSSQTIKSIKNISNTTIPKTENFDVKAGTIDHTAQILQDPSSSDIGKTWSSKWERLTVPAQGRVVLANVTGSGYAETVNMAIAAPGPTADLSQVEYYVDGNTVPSVIVRYGLSGTYGGYPFSSKYISCTGGRGRSQYGCTYQMKVPYKRSLIVQMFNHSGVGETIWGWLQGNTGGNRFLDRYSVAHSISLGDQYYNEVTVQPLSEQTLMDVKARGALWAVKFFLDRHNNKAGGDENCIEGNFRYYIDGAKTPSYESSGTEDYFGSAFEFMNVGYAGANGTQTPYATEDFGTFYNQWSNASGTSAMDDQSSSFRIHSTQPVFFNSEMKVTWQCGDVGNGLTTTTAAGIAADIIYYTDK